MTWGRGRYGFGPDEWESRWWWPQLKGESMSRPYKLAMFILDALEAAIPEREGLVVSPQNGEWSRGDEAVFRVSDSIIGSIGIPKNHEGAAHFAADEIEKAAAVVFARCFLIDEYIGDGTDDTWVYLEHGRFYLYFGHDQITQAFAREEAPLEEFDEEIIRRGWGWLRELDSNEVTS